MPDEIHILHILETCSLHMWIMGGGGVLFGPLITSLDVIGSGEDQSRSRYLICKSKCF